MKSDHDASMPNFSVKDQYCDLATGNWHETVYVGSEKCHVHWYEKFVSPQKITFSPNHCMDGYRLDYCVRGACPESAINSVPNSREHPVSVL
jgi:hypothetical protein